VLCFCSLSFFITEKYVLDISREDLIMNLGPLNAGFHPEELFTQELLDECNAIIQANVGECCPLNSRLSIPDTPFLGVVNTQTIAWQNVNAPRV